MTSTCTATKRDNSPCTLPSSGAAGLCWAHDPKNAERRRRGQSRGGKGKRSGGELTAIKARLSELAEAVIRGEVDRGDAAVFAQLHNVYLRAVTVELAVRDQTELIARLESLEEIQQAGRGYAS